MQVTSIMQSALTCAEIKKVNVVVFELVILLYFSAE